MTFGFDPQTVLNAPVLHTIGSRLWSFAAGPLTGLNTRYYWVFLIEAVVLLALVHVARGGTLEDFFRHRVPAKQLWHRSTLVDWQINIANALVTPSIKVFWRFSAPAVIAADILRGAEHLLGPAPHLWHASLPVLLMVTLLVTIADDLGYYVFHCAAHTVPWLWAFHKVHHSAEVLTPLVAGRVHPVEMVLSEPVRAIFAGCALAPALYLFAGDINVLTVGGISVTALLFGALGNQLLHSETPISFGDPINRVLVSPAVHQIHHSAAPAHRNRNMGGLLSVWDWMFGTLWLPRKGEAITYGLGACTAREHPHVIAAYIRPFQDITADLARRLERPGTAGQQGTDKTA